MCVGVRESFICVCRCIHIYMYTWKTPWVHTDTLCANRNTCIRICVVRVVVCIHMYTYIYEKTPCVNANLHMCVYILACIHADFICGCVDVSMYVWVCGNIYIYVRRVYMCMCTYLHVWSPSLLCVYTITSMHTEFESVGRCLHICTLSLHVFVYISTYIHTETTCVWVCIYIYVHQVYRCVYAEYICVCVYLHTCTPNPHECVHIFTYMHTCV